MGVFPRATTHASGLNFISMRIYPRIAICWSTQIIVMPMIITPFPYIAMHVLQAIAIRIVFVNLARLKRVNIRLLIVQSSSKGKS
jgi:hypothetical protein